MAKKSALRKTLKILILNSCIIIAAVVCYSPGLLALRLSDASIFRAGMSIIAGLALLVALIYGNYKLLEEPRREWISDDDGIDTKAAEQILKNYFGGKYFGKLARTAADQMERFTQTAQKASEMISRRFEKGSLSWEKYISVIEAARRASLKNIAAMANRMQMFDEKEYDRLQHYKEDDIPDDIQEQKINLYQMNISRIRDAIAANEKLLLKLESLMMEFTSENKDENADELLEEISRLTDEIKYYE